MEILVLIGIVSLVIITLGYISTAAAKERKEREAKDVYQKGYVRYRRMASGNIMVPVTDIIGDLEEGIQKLKKIRKGEKKGNKVWHRCNGAIIVYRGKINFYKELGKKEVTNNGQA